MKKLMIALCVLFCASAYANVPLGNGQIIPIMINDAVSSSEGGSASATVLTDVKSLQGDILISKGTPVILKIEKTSKKGVGKPGKVSINCISVNSVDGQAIQLNGNVTAEGKNKRGKALGLGLGLTFTGFGAIIGLPCLAIKGGDAVIEQGTLINAQVMGYYNIDVQK
ncbi:MAG: hypothetical protein IKU59_00790 [Bacteroidales bacterium]|nr:hypothetical protein [Bacteroidales bacterium]